MQDWIVRVAKIPVDDTNEEPDVCIIELGGTVGDIESMPFVEALTQLRRRAGKKNFMQIHVSYIPVINGEQKTKPTQQAARAVRSAGLLPDLVSCEAVLLVPGVFERVVRGCKQLLKELVICVMATRPHLHCEIDGTLMALPRCVWMLLVSTS